MSLHNASELVKKIFKVALIGGGTFLTLIFMMRIGGAIKNIVFPPRIAPPDAKYGKLPAIPFGEPALKEDFTYSVETVTGTLPTFPDRINVYKIVHKPTTLLNSRLADSKAAAINMIDASGTLVPHTITAQEQFEWVDTSTQLTRTLDMDINTYNFKLQSPYIDYPPILESSYIANQEGAKSLVSRMLTNMGLSFRDIDGSKLTSELLSIKNGTLVPAISLSAAQIVRVDLFQTDIDKMPIYYPRYPRSIMEFLVTARSLDISDIVDARFTHREIKFPDPGAINSDDVAVYPIKTTAEAFEELQNGKGFISNYYGSSKEIKITEVTLGYFLGDQKQEYVLPVFAFHGSDGEFYGFVPAIRDEWFEK